MAAALAGSASVPSFRKSSTTSPTPPGRSSLVSTGLPSASKVVLIPSAKDRRTYRVNEIIRLDPLGEGVDGLGLMVDQELDQSVAMVDLELAMVQKRYDPSGTGI